MHTQAAPNRLSELIDRKGVRLAQLAVLCDRDQSTVYRWTKGQTIPDDCKVALARYFGVSVDHLMGWDGPDPDLPVAA